MELRGIDCLIIAGHEGNYGARTANFRYVSNYAMWYDDEYIVFPLEGEPSLIAFNTAHYDWAKRGCWIPIKVRGISGMRNYVLVTTFTTSWTEIMVTTSWTRNFERMNPAMP
jgi:hypothetical protein